MKKHGWMILGCLVAVQAYASDFERGLIRLCGLEPQLRCEKRFGEMSWEGLTFKRYSLRADHFPEGSKFQLIVKGFDGGEMQAFTYIANRKGHLILQPTKEIEGGGYAICPVKKGERLQFIMRSSGEKDILTEVVAFPLQMRSNQGALLELELAKGLGDQFEFYASHLKPGEQVEIACQFDQSHVGMSMRADDKGELNATISLPEGTGGSAILKINRESEEVLFPFEWGPEALKYVGACCLQLK